MTLPDDVAALIRAMIQRVEDDPVLVIKPTELALPDYPARSLRTLELSPAFDQARDLAFERRYRLAVVIDAPQTVGHARTRRMLAYLRNVGAHGVLAAFSRAPLSEADSPDWSVADFLGLGFRRAEQATSLTSAYWVYRYNIYDYKITPDWLNSRYWANPEQWDQQRW